MEADDDDRRRKASLAQTCTFVAMSLTLSLFLLVRDPLPYTDDGGLDFNRLIEPEINPRRFHNLFRMERSTFLSLVDRLRPYMERDERYTTFEERIGAVIVYFAHPMSQPGFQELIQRSGSYISETLHEVVSAIKSSLSLSQFSRPDATDGDYAFNRFHGVIGSLDGTHIPVTVDHASAASFRDRKGEISQNVLVAINLEMKPCFVLAGGEGCGNDQTLLDHARQLGFEIPPGCFLLGDAGFSLTSSILTPYRGVRYHLNEFGPGGSRPRNMKELFNLRHARLRAAVERFFGMLKEKFPVLRVQLPFRYLTFFYSPVFFFFFFNTFEIVSCREVAFQTELIMAVILVFNFILELEGDHFDLYPPELWEPAGDEDDMEEEVRDAVAEELRDRIANLMWLDYQRFLNRRNQ